MTWASIATDNGAWVRRFHPAPEATTRLVCFPHAGGSASYYFPVSRTLSPEIDVLAIQYPGRQDRRAEPCVPDLRTLADLVVQRLAPWLDRPLALFGHSMGATLAFEVAVRLERSGTVPLSLFASGRRAPSRHRTETVHLLDDDGLIANVKRLSGTATQILDDDEVLRMVLPSIRSDYKAAETYRYQPVPRLHCPVVVLTGDQDPQVTLDEAEAWANHTTGTFELTRFSGGHFFLNNHAHRVTKELRDHLTDR
ncbi:thioesterase II family protein [Streptomyces sp. NPDC058239]|uniref:thioesterase II family protein n=1 Tax=Streptomyces sp. NPDC058239 TaxID=3346395 RepID=UPI0036E1089F